MEGGSSGGLLEAEKILNKKIKPGRKRACECVRVCVCRAVCVWGLAGLVQWLGHRDAVRHFDMYRNHDQFPP